MKRFLIIMSILAVLCGTVWAATYNDFTSGDLTLSRSAIEPVKDYIPFIQYRQFNFGHANLNSGSGVTNGDVVTLFNVLQDTIIEEFGYRVTTAALRSGVSAELGDGNDIDGFVGNDYTDKGIPFIDLSTTSTGVSHFGTFAGPNYSGSTQFMVGGVSIYVGGTSTPMEVNSNNGPYFTSGASFYLSDDTIDMTVYVPKDGTTLYSGTTPIFEAYIKGFKRLVP